MWITASAGDEPLPILANVYIVVPVEEEKESKMSANDDMIQRLIDRLTNDPEFRERMAADPAGTAQAEGFAISPDELKRFLGIPTASDEELRNWIENPPETTVDCATTLNCTQGTLTPHCG